MKKLIDVYLYVNLILGCVNFIMFYCIGQNITFKIKLFFCSVDSIIFRLK